ncbi:MAG TPA: glycosyl hydrolase [Thermoanaerobaculia bacterium]|nr:glycosyl hydrolase [Thermoanaerobaculia bacterium]
MKPQKSRYKLAFFALGWLIAAGILFQVVLGTGFQRIFSAVDERVSRVAQYFSDRQGRAIRSARQTSRSEYLQPLHTQLNSVTALRNPPSMLYGIYDGGFPNTFAGMERLETALRFKFPIISFYSAWGDKPAQQFPIRMAETIHRMGSVPMITWEPWVVDFDARVRTNLPPVAEREYASLAAIAKGDYDFYIVPWAKAAAEYKRPIFLRFAHEMNDPYRYPWGPQNGNRPEDFVAAWKHVHVVFQKMGATNVLWVWSPHISMPWFEFYYPGPEYVDWIGVGVLNYGTIASWSRWWSFHQILEKAYPQLLRMQKPVMISEFGTLAQGGEMAEWYRQAFYHMTHTYSRGVRAVVFFNQPSDLTISPNYPLNWSVTQSQKASEVVAGEIARTTAL